MTRGYLNALSFPAEDLDSALEMLQKLRTGIARLLKSQLLSVPIMCSLRASELPLSPAYEVLGNGISRQGGRFRDTVFFFLNVLDQRSPAHVELDPDLHEDALQHAVEGLEGTLESDRTRPLMACALDTGVLLSIGSREPWTRNKVSFSALIASQEAVKRFECDNICDIATAGSVEERLESAKKELVFLNWDYLTGGAERSSQILEWFVDCRRRPGLEQLIMRSVGLARRADYRIDGDLIKKLRIEDEITIFEVRAYFNGSNNVRLLFSRSEDGRALYGFGGIKSAPDWYDHAVPQAARHIKDVLRRLSA
jgi:hypothetical protein